MFRAFTDHPESVGETYFEHMGSAWSFAASLALAAACCFLHGVFPFAFQKGGSRRVVSLHQRMVTNRHRHALPAGVFGWADGI